MASCKQDERLHMSVTTLQQRKNVLQDEITKYTTMVREKKEQLQKFSRGVPMTIAGLSLAFIAAPLTGGASVAVFAFAGGLGLGAVGCTIAGYDIKTIEVCEQAIKDLQTSIETTERIIAMIDEDIANLHNHV